MNYIPFLGEGPSFWQMHSCMEFTLQQEKKKEKQGMVMGKTGICCGVSSVKEEISAVKRRQ